MSARAPGGRLGTLPAPRRRAVVWVSVAVWATGVVWLLFKYFVRVTDEFGFDNPHPWQRAWLIAHAFAALAALWLFGVLWRGHVVRGWTLRERRPTGGTLFGVTVWLTLTGCALYYIGSDSLRAWTSFAHWIPGVAALALFLVHRRHDD
jgi:hypothetical protein